MPNPNVRKHRPDRDDIEMEWPPADSRIGDQTHHTGKDMPIRQTAMVGFPQAWNCTNLVSSWRQSESRAESAAADACRTIGQPVPYRSAS